MAAFDKVKSGIPALDQALDYIRMGDNVVWRVSNLDEFRRFADPFVEQAKKDGRNIIYFRFASHPELVAECPEVKRVIQDGVQTSRFYQVMNSYQRTLEEQYVDSWDRFFNQTKLLHDSGLPVEEQCARMCNIMMTRDERLRILVKKHFRPEDYFRVRDHMVGTGMVGGKTCGMLLARAILRNSAPDIDHVLEPHDSFYVGSDVFYTYIVDNDFWDLRIRQRTEEGYFPLAGALAEKLKTGVFSPDTKEQFKHILEYYGQDPYIVRSSSILEDGFDNAFAGKYESVFCANRGTPEERLEEFENAVRTVYASSASLSALDYRKRRGLDKRDEQMALLVMRVSGSAYGSYYMPCAAGVGYSFSPYKFLRDIDSSAGMLRLVMGLGTSAVDRTEGSYPRLVSLDKPEATSSTTSAEKHRFSQRKVEVVDLKTRSLNRVTLQELEPVLPSFLQYQVLEHDTEAEAMFRERGEYRSVCFISCLGIVRNKELMKQMQRLMRLIQDEYGEPVDIEYTVNVSENGEYMINLLQCRPLQVFRDSGSVTIPENSAEDETLLETRGASMGLSQKTKLDLIAYVDPIKYYNLPYIDKPEIAALIGRINWKYRDQGKHMMLMVPGRIGTSSPELGVPTAFSDISSFEAICEMAESRAGYNPELSYGSHIFQDLVEAQILYTAMFPGERTPHFCPDLLKHFQNIVSELPQGEKWKDVVTLIDVSGQNCMLYHDLTNEHILVCISSPDKTA